MPDERTYGFNHDDAQSLIQGIGVGEDWFPEIKPRGQAGGGGHSIWGTIEEVVCLEEETYCWVTVTNYSGKCGEAVPGEITDSYDEHFEMIKVEQVCEIFMAYYTEEQLVGLVLEAGLFWEQVDGEGECLPKWLVRQVCGQPGCA